MHVKSGEDPKTNLEHHGEITYLLWPGKAPRGAGGSGQEGGSLGCNEKSTPCNFNQNTTSSLHTFKGVLQTIMTETCSCFT